MAPAAGGGGGASEQQAVAAAAAASRGGAGAGADGERRRIEMLLAQGKVEEYKRAIQSYARNQYRGSVHFIEPQAVPDKASLGGRRGGGQTAAGGKAWDLRALCEKLQPLAPWSDVRPHPRFTHLPALNIDLLAHADRDVRNEALDAMVRLNKGSPHFFKENPLTAGRRKDYKPPQRHQANQTLTGDQAYRTPFLEFFAPQPQPVGVTDVGQVTYGLEPVEGLPDIPEAQRVEAEETLTYPGQFQGDRYNLQLFVGLLGEQIHYPSLSRDVFVRMHDGQVDRVLDGSASPSICYIDGVSGPLPTLYIERSGVKATRKTKKAKKAAAAAAAAADGGGGRRRRRKKGRCRKEDEEDEEEQEEEEDFEAASKRLWFTRTHNEFGCLSFLNLMHASGREDEGTLAILEKDEDAVIDARRKMQGFKLWIFVLNDNAENVRRADLYAQTYHQLDSWHQFVDWVEGGNRDFTVRVTDLLDCGVDVALTIQQPGQLIVGGPGCSHGVVQHGATFAVAVNICHLDLMHMAVRMGKGGDLHFRGNRKTVGQAPWYKITADSIRSILRSLENDLRRVVAPDTGFVSAENKRRLRRLEADVEQLQVSVQAVLDSMKAQGMESTYSKTLLKQGWKDVYEGEFRQLQQALSCAIYRNGSADEVYSLLIPPLPSPSSSSLPAAAAATTAAATSAVPSEPEGETEAPASSSSSFMEPDVITDNEQPEQQQEEEQEDEEEQQQQPAPLPLPLPPQAETQLQPPQEEEEEEQQQQQQRQQQQEKEEEEQQHEPPFKKARGETKDGLEDEEEAAAQLPLSPPRPQAAAAARDTANDDGCSCSSSSSPPPLMLSAPDTAAAPAAAGAAAAMDTVNDDGGCCCSSSSPPPLMLSASDVTAAVGAAAAAAAEAVVVLMEKEEAEREVASYATAAVVGSGVDASTGMEEGEEMAEATKAAAATDVSAADGVGVVAEMQ